MLSGGAPGAHKIDGVGAGFVVPLWRRDVADRIERVSTEDAVAMTLRLAREEGLFAGTSTGANVIAAMRLAEELGPDATVVTIMCDTGMKYLARLSSRGAEGDEGSRLRCSEPANEFRRQDPSSLSLLGMTAGHRSPLEAVHPAATSSS